MKNPTKEKFDTIEEEQLREIFIKSFGKSHKQFTKNQLGNMVIGVYNKYADVYNQCQHGAHVWLKSDKENRELRDRLEEVTHYHIKNFMRNFT